MRASEVNFKTAKILKMCKYQSLSFYVPLGAVLQISGGISHQRRKKKKKKKKLNVQVSKLDFQEEIKKVVFFFNSLRKYINKISWAPIDFRRQFRF